MKDNVHQLFDGVMKFIGDASVLLGDQPVQQMEEVQAEVQKLCEIINKMPLEQRLEYRQELNQLAEGLQELEGKLLQKRDEVREELGASQTHSTASKAYVVANQRDKPDNDN